MISGIIAKANGKDKVIDFRDGLVLADLEDYAMIHGCGGKAHAATSIIKIGICDYSAGKGQKSKTVFANITPDVCVQLLEICKRNIGTTVYDGAFPVFQEQRAVNRKTVKLADMMADTLHKALTVFSRAESAAEQGNPPSGTDMMKALNQLWTKTRDRVFANEQGSEPAFFTMAQHVDYNYSQDRVHSQRIGADGLAPVQRLNIFHQTYRKDGAMGRYPWTVKISNGRAKVKVQATGATTFDSSSMTDITEAFIQVSDADMFRMMYRVVRYIEVWEIAMGIQLVMDGRRKRDDERKQYSNTGR